MPEHAGIRQRVLELTSPETRISWLLLGTPQHVSRSQDLLGQEHILTSYMWLLSRSCCTSFMACTRVAFPPIIALQPLLNVQMLQTQATQRPTRACKACSGEHCTPAQPSAVDSGPSSAQCEGDDSLPKLIGEDEQGLDHCLRSHPPGRLKANGGQLLDARQVAQLPTAFCAAELILPLIQAQSTPAAVPDALPSAWPEFDADVEAIMAAVQDCTQPGASVSLPG